MRLQWKVFSAHAATTPWASSQKKTWKKWHRKVLKELGPDLKYLSFHPYYRGHKPEYMLQFINVLIKDIKSSSNPKIKLYMSEHAKWPQGRDKGEKNWRKNWYQTHALIGCLDTAEWMILMINNPEVKLTSKAVRAKTSLKCYTVPPKSLVLLALKPIIQNVVSIFEPKSRDAENENF